MSLTRALVERAALIAVDAFDEADHATVRTLLLDHLAVTAGGSATDSAQAAQRFVLALGGRESAARMPVIGTQFTAPPVEAAMANAVAAHSIEYDDTHNPSSSHPGVVVFPAALAAAALAGAGGRTFVEGVAVGYEVMCRVGRAAHPPALYARHFHPTATLGPMGAAAATCRILRMGVQETVWALGIAADAAAGSMQFIVDGAWTKRWHPALAVRNGVHAALLARNGFRGTDDGIAGERGFLAGYSTDPRPELLLAGWGDRPLEIRATSIKPHTTCRYNQAAVDAVIALRQAHTLQPDDIERINVGLPSVALDIVCEPRAAKCRPQSVVDAQFSLPYSVAVALLRGRNGLEEFDGGLLDDPVVCALMDRVHAHADGQADRSYPERWEADVVITTTDGRALAFRTLEAKGDPANPLSSDELQIKFHDLTSSVYSLDRRRSIIAAVDGIGEVEGPRQLIELLKAETSMSEPPASLLPVAATVRR